MAEYGIERRPICVCSSLLRFGVRFWFPFLSVSTITIVIWAESLHVTDWIIVFVKEWTILMDELVAFCTEYG